MPRDQRIGVKTVYALPRQRKKHGSGPDDLVTVHIMMRFRLKLRVIEEAESLHQDMSEWIRGAILERLERERGGPKSRG